MDASKQARFKELTEELAALLYEESDPEEVKTLEGIETSIREHLLERVGPELGHFLSVQAAAQVGDESAQSLASSDR
jgi:hypothetical protein